MEIEPLVTVFCPTYNHKKYIRQCLESFVMQKTNFQIEIIVQDDASTDGTSEIVMEFAQKYSFVIPVIYKENIYSQGKSLNEYIFKNARGKYIAMCEGDDFWTDPYKLQKQVDFLENNLKYSFCGHEVEIYDEIKNIKIGKYASGKRTFGLKDTILGPPMHTSSLVYRNNFKLPTSMSRLPAGDDVLECILASKGLAFSFPETMSVYRLSEVGTWSTLSQIEKNYKILIVQLWILRNFPLLIIKQTRRINDLIQLIKKEKKALLKTVIIKDKLTIFFAILFYKSYMYTSFIKNKLFPR
jgi:glycosyltransferase involved in cell wall biosynthesis